MDEMYGGDGSRWICWNLDHGIFNSRGERRRMKKWIGRWNRAKLIELAFRKLLERSSVP